MNAYARNYFTELPPCRCCGLEPMRVYCDATDRYAVKCDCGRRTKGFTTIAGASHSWNAMNKKAPSVRVPVPRAAEEKRIWLLYSWKGAEVKCTYARTAALNLSSHASAR